MNSKSSDVLVGIASLIMLAGIAMTAFAQQKCPSDSACIEWKPSPGWTDGTPFESGTVITYVVFRYDPVNNTGIPLGHTTALSMRVDKQPRGKQCYMVTARLGTLESEPSPQICKVMRFAGPTEGAIEAPTDGAIESK